MTGWIAVQRNVLIDIDINTTPLEIRSDSELRTRDEAEVYFYTSQGVTAGGVKFNFYYSPQYFIYRCSEDWTEFPTNPPTARVKVWSIMVTRSSSKMGLQILCNGKEVLNTVLSVSECPKFWDRWFYDYWNRDIAKIGFSKWDTMSDYYRPYQPGN